MRSNALYFPYINVPQSSWVLSSLLYWERFSAIVPYEYVAEPRRYSPWMRDLVAAGLVKTIQPVDHMDGLPQDVGLPFVDVAQRWLDARGGDTGTHFASIHAEKIGDWFFGPLQEMGVLTPGDYPWYRMPTPLANRFMAYLATLLAELDSVDATPLTDSEPRTRVFGGNARDDTRSQLLSKVIPLPLLDDTADIDAIVAFKERYGSQAARFRRRIEEEVIAIASVADLAQRNEMAALVGTRLSDEIDELHEALAGRWRKIVFGSLLPVVPASATLAATAAGPAVAAGLAATSLATAIYSAVATFKDVRGLAHRPLAYAALFRRARKG